jgi:DNA-binding NtrC family response regulator
VPVEAAPSLDLPESGVDLPALVHRIERDLIGRALVRTEGNRADAARLLGLKRTTLVEKLKRLPELTA